jgi:signal transduction histidine kinase/ActR/RegA family two-component response regulator
MSLRAHLTSLVVAALLPVLAFAAVLEILFSRLERATAEQGMTQTARALATAVDRELASSVTTLEALVASRRLEQGDLREFQVDMERVLRGHPEWRTLVLATAAGETVIDLARADASPASILDRESFEQAIRTGRPAVGNLTSDRLRNRPEIPIHVPVMHEGRVESMLSAVLRPEAIGAVLAGQRTPAGWTAAVLDRRRTMVARSRQSEDFVARPSTLPVAALHAEDGWTRTSDLEGGESYVAFSRAPQNGWTVLIASPVDAVEGSTMRSLRLLTIGGMVLLAAGVFLASLFGRRIAGAIESLSVMADSLRRGDVPPKLTFRLREVGEVASAIEAAGQERRRIDSELRARLRQGQALAQIGRHALAGWTLQDLLDETAGLVARTLGVEYVQVMELLPGGDTLLLRAGMGWPPECVGRATSSARDHSQAGYTLLIDEPVVVDEMATEQRFVAAGPVDERAIVSGMTVAIRGEVRPWGVLGAHTTTHRSFSADDVQFLTAVANLVAITIQRKRLEEIELSARAEAEAANRTKDEFLATLSHELRTPLSAVLGWARLLRAGKVDDDTMARALETIERNARSQAQLIEDLLDVSRIISGKLRLEVRQLDLPPVIEAALDVVRGAAEAKRVALETSLDRLLGPVAGDPDRLQQVVWNLLSNAVKFTSEGGRVEIRLERVAGRAEIRVSDTGAGIPPELLPHIFERFRQGDGSSTRSHGGLGLGLAIVRHIVELHGGSARAESDGPGRGSTFTISLPLAVVWTPEPTALAASTGHGAGTLRPAPILAGIGVLIVDDLDDARDLLKTLLEQYGAEVRTAGSAPAALAMLAQFPTDVLVSDIEMPDQDGYALIRALRERKPAHEASVPAVALTAYASAGDRVRALAAGFQVHVAKPVDPGELVDIVSKLAGGSAARA